MIAESPMCDCCGSEDVEPLFAVRHPQPANGDYLTKTSDGHWYCCRKCDRRWFREESFAERRARLAEENAASASAAD